MKTAAVEEEEEEDQEDEGAEDVDGGGGLRMNQIKLGEGEMVDEWGDIVTMPSGGSRGGGGGGINQFDDGEDDDEDDHEDGFDEFDENEDDSLDDDDDVEYDNTEDYNEAEDNTMKDHSETDSYMFLDDPSAKRSLERPRKRKRGSMPFSSRKTKRRLKRIAAQQDRRQHSQQGQVTEGYTSTYGQDKQLPLSLQRDPSHVDFNGALQQQSQQQQILQQSEASAPPQQPYRKHKKRMQQPAQQLQKGGADGEDSGDEADDFSQDELGLQKPYQHEWDDESEAFWIRASRQDVINEHVAEMQRTLARIRVKTLLALSEADDGQIARMSTDAAKLSRLVSFLRPKEDKADKDKDKAVGKKRDEKGSAHNVKTEQAEVTQDTTTHDEKHKGVQWKYFNANAGMEAILKGFYQD